MANGCLPTIIFLTVSYAGKPEIPMCYSALIDLEEDTFNVLGKHNSGGPFTVKEMNNANIVVLRPVIIQACMRVLSL